MTETLLSQVDMSTGPTSLWSRLAPKAPAFPCMLRVRYDAFRRPHPEVDAIVVDGSDRVDRGAPLEGAKIVLGWLDDVRGCGLHICRMEATRALATPRAGRTTLSTAAIEQLRTTLNTRLAVAGWPIPREGGECIFHLWRTNRGPRLDISWAGPRAWSETLYADVQTAAAAWLTQHVTAFAGIQRLGAVLTLPVQD